MGDTVLLNFVDILLDVTGKGLIDSKKVKT